MSDLFNFVRESNKIEGILRVPSDAEMDAHRRLLKQDDLDVNDIELFVSAIAPTHKLRRTPDLNVRVGKHIAPPGGSAVVKELDAILMEARDGGDAYDVHHRYETLHPFTDGNGRSGRALWLWMQRREGLARAIALGFLHSWYYQSLERSQHRT